MPTFFFPKKIYVKKKFRQKNILLIKNLCNKNFAISRGYGKVKVRSRQRKHNCNYNIMGFDTIEINLVSAITDPILTKL